MIVLEISKQLQPGQTNRLSFPTPSTIEEVL